MIQIQRCDLLRGRTVAGRILAERFPDQRIDNDTPTFVAITTIAPGVRLRTFEILVVPAFAFAMDFIVR